MRGTCLFFILITVCPVTTAMSLNEFLKNNPDINNNVVIRNNVIDFARMHAMTDAPALNQDDDTQENTEDTLLKTQGDGYALIALREISNMCEAGQGKSLQLSQQDCHVVSAHAW